MRGRGRTVYLRVKGRPDVVRRLERGCVGNAGPYPSIAGMRSRYWGRDCMIVRAGAYIYNMGRDVGQDIQY